MAEEVSLDERLGARMMDRGGKEANLGAFGFRAGATAAQNDQAVTEAVGRGFRRLFVPEAVGARYRYGDATAALLPRLSLRGAHHENVVLEYDGAAGRALVFPGGVGQCYLEHLSVVSGSPGSGVGVSLDGSQFNVLQHVLLYGFELGVDFNDRGAFAAYNWLRWCTVNGCRNGLRAKDGTNNCGFEEGRILSSVDRGDGIGADIHDVESFRLDGTAIETADLALRIDGVNASVSLEGCYIEPGEGGRAYDIRRARKLSGRATTVNAASARVSLPFDGLHDFDGTTRDYHGAALHGATAAERNHLPGGDLARDGYGSSAQGGVVTTFEPDGEGVAVRAMVLGPTPAGGGVSHRLYRFRRGAGTAAETVCVRLRKPQAAGQALLVVESGGVPRQTFLSEASAGPEEIAIVCDPDPADPWLNVRIYPDAAGGDPAAALRLLGIWAVSGRYAATFRPYGEQVELLERPELIDSGVDLTADRAAVPRGPARPPAGVRGMRLRITVRASQAQAANSFVHVTGPTIGTIHVVAVRNGLPQVTEVTVPGASVSVGASNGGNPGNALSFKVEVVQYVV